LVTLFDSIDLDRGWPGVDFSWSLRNWYKQATLLQEFKHKKNNRCITTPAFKKLKNRILISCTVLEKVSNWIKHEISVPKTILFFKSDEKCRSSSTKMKTAVRGAIFDFLTMLNYCKKMLDHVCVQIIINLNIPQNVT
jgi:hypothetical protein